MPDITAQEAMPNILVKEATPAVPTTTRDKVVADARKKLEESTWEESAKVIIKPVEGGKIAQKIEQIGIERDATTGAKVRTPEEQVRYEAALKESALAQKYIEVGYDQLSRDDQTSLRTKILEEAQRQPLIADAVRGLTPTQKQAYVERLLRDPRLRNEAQGRIEELVNSPDLVNAVSEAKASLREAEDNLSDAIEDQKEADRRFRQAKALADAYRLDARGNPIGDKAIDLAEMEENRITNEIEIPDYEQRVTTAESRIQTLQRELEVAQNAPITRPITDVDEDIQGTRDELDSLAEQIAAASGAERGVLLRREDNTKQELRELNREKQLIMRTAIPRDTETIKGDIERAQNDANQARKDLNERKAKKQLLQDMRTEQARAQEDLETASAAKREKDVAVRSLQAEFSKRQKTLADAKALRESQEQDLVTGFSTIIETATREQMIDEIEKAKSALDQAIAEQKTKAASDDEKEMYDALREEWLGPEKRRKRGIPGFRAETRYRPINKTRVNADFIYLMNNGPDDLMKRILYGRVNPSTGANYTAEETDDLMKNESFVNKMQPEMVKHLIGRKILTGGITSEDVDIILQSPWGGDAMIDKALAEKSDLRAAVEKVMGQGALDRHGFKERFGQIARKHPVWMLLLLGLPVAAIGALTMEAAAETVNQQRS